MFTISALHLIIFSTKLRGFGLRFAQAEYKETNMTDETITTNDNVVSIFGDSDDYRVIPHELYTEENKIKASDMLQSIAEDTDRPLDDIIVISTTMEGDMELFSNVSDILRLIGMLEKVKGRLVG